jgi:hypothetical protein
MCRLPRTRWPLAAVGWVVVKLWYGTVQDTKTDGYCVSLWTINSAGQKQGRIARSCGLVTLGSTWGGGSEDAYGVRLFRDNGNYKTIVWP